MEGAGDPRGGREFKRGRGPFGPEGPDGAGEKITGNSKYDVTQGHENQKK